MTTKHGYGWIPDIPDHRDFPYSAIRKIPEKLPASVDLRSLCSPIEDQGQLGSCTAHALAGALQFLEIKDKTTYTDLSRLFIYYNERVIEGTTQSDSGAMLRDGIKTLANQGVSNESLWKYDISKFAVSPPVEAYNEAINYKILSYYRIQTLDEMKACLAEGYPFVFGFTVYESFESAEVARTGIVPMPLSGEKVLGGHAVLCVGYDDSKQMFSVRNSWGENWGVKGYFLMPYEYLSNRNLSDDLWTIRTDVTDNSQPPSPPSPTKSVWQRFIEWLKKVFHS